jgi:hypothetical protein
MAPRRNSRHARFVPNSLAPKFSYFTRSSRRGCTSTIAGVVSAIAFIASSPTTRRSWRRITCYVFLPPYPTGPTSTSRIPGAEKAQRQRQMREEAMQLFDDGHIPRG